MEILWITVLTDTWQQNDPMRVEGTRDIPRTALERIVAIAESTAAEVGQLLPALSEDILLWVRAGKDVIPETGEGGASLRPGLVEWVVDPDRTGGILECADTRLRSTLFHELHHQVRGWVMRGGSHPATLMDAAVAEGLATVFARDEAGDKAPWGEYPPEVSDWVAEIEAVKDMRDYRQWMFRLPDGRRWVGYRAGAYVCDRAIALSGLTAAELVGESAERIVALAELGGGSRPTA